MSEVKVWFCKLHNCGGTSKGCPVCNVDCLCEDCKSHAWDEVNELQGSTGCPACKAEGCNCYVIELPIVTNP